MAAPMQDFSLDYWEYLNSLPSEDKAAMLAENSRALWKMNHEVRKKQKVSFWRKKEADFWASKSGDLRVSDDTCASGDSTEFNGFAVLDSLDTDDTDLIRAREAWKVFKKHRAAARYNEALARRSLGLDPPTYPPGFGPQPYSMVGPHTAAQYGPQLPSSYNDYEEGPVIRTGWDE